MREYALNRAQMAGSSDASPLALFRHWLARRYLTKLASTHEAAAEFSGITVADLEWAIRLPLATDPRLALEDRLFHKARRLIVPAAAIQQA